MIRSTHAVDTYASLPQPGQTRVPFPSTKARLSSYNTSQASVTTFKQEDLYRDHVNENDQPYPKAAKASTIGYLHKKAEMMRRSGGIYTPTVSSVAADLDRERSYEEALQQRGSHLRGSGSTSSSAMEETCGSTGHVYLPAVTSGASSQSSSYSGIWGVPSRILQVWKCYDFF